jgi:hypothetical protein
MQGDCEWRNEKYVKDSVATSLTHFRKIPLDLRKYFRQISHKAENLTWNLPNSKQNKAFNWDLQYGGIC